VKYSKESEFGEKFVEILHKLGFETWQEVYLSRKHYASTPCVDIIAKLHNVYFSFELKLTLNDDVLSQAHYNRKYVDYSYVVVPPRKKLVSNIKKFYASYYNIGVLFVDPIVFLKLFDRNQKDVLLQRILKVKRTLLYGSLNGYMFLPAKRVFRKHKFVKGKYKGKYEIETFLFDEQKESIAGSSATTERSTPFKRSCAMIYAYLQENPYATKIKVWEDLNTDLHWKSYNSMCSSFRAFSNLDVMKKIIWRNKK